MALLKQKKDQDGIVRGMAAEIMEPIYSNA
jgi:hypothetical protein